MLTLENVSLNYGSFTALNGVSLHADQGELVVLLGAELTALLQQIAADTEKADSDDPDQNNPDDDSEAVT